MKNHANIWRLTQAGLAILLVFLLLNSWLGRQYQAQLLLAQQTDEQIMLLTDQIINSATPLLQFNHKAELQQLAHRLVADPRFVSTSVFNEEGERLAFAQSVYLDTEAFDDKALQQALTHFPVTTEFVQQGDERLGFIRFRINRDQFFTAIRAQHHHQQQQLLLLLLGAGLCGAMLARAFSFKRARYKKNLLAGQKRLSGQSPLPQPNDTQAHTAKLPASSAPSATEPKPETRAKTATVHTQKQIGKNAADSDKAP